MVKFVVISDTHNGLSSVEIPDGDILIHCGDFTDYGTVDEFKKFNEDIGALPHAVKVVIAGNHDWLLQSAPETARKALYNCVYLQDEGYEIDGIKLWGSPWQPFFHDFAFNLHRGKALKEKWDLIPEDTDILITHGPPGGKGDLIHSFNSLVIENIGCEDLRDAVERIAPKYHLFGHCHVGHGVVRTKNTTYINAAIMNEAMDPINSPIEFTL